jgi:hypothetical protein
MLLNELCMILISTVVTEGTQHFEILNIIRPINCAKNSDCQNELIHDHLPSLYSLLSLAYS